MDDFNGLHDSQETKNFLKFLFLDTLTAAREIP